jgi:CBS domain-containing membrane protein
VLLKVGDIMTTEVTVARATETLEQAFVELELGHIRHLPVVDRNLVLVGLVSQRDLIAAPRGANLRIRDIMQTDVKAVSPDTQAHEAAYLLLRYAIGCLPVTDHLDRVCGIVTEADFVRVAYVHLGGKVPVEDLQREEREAEIV